MKVYNHCFLFKPSFNEQYIDMCLFDNQLGEIITRRSVKCSSIMLYVRCTWSEENAYHCCSFVG